MKQKHLHLPTKTKMRFHFNKKGRIIENRDWDIPKGEWSTYMPIIKGLIEKNIGKPFNDLYQYICTRFRGKMDVPFLGYGYSIRDSLNGMFKWTWTGYYIEEGIIRKH